MQSRNQLARKAQLRISKRRQRKNAQTGPGTWIKVTFLIYHCHPREGSIGKAQVSLNLDRLCWLVHSATKSPTRKSTDPINLERRANLERWEEVLCRMVIDSAFKIILPKIWRDHRRSRRSSPNLGGAQLVSEMLIRLWAAKKIKIPNTGKHWNGKSKWLIDTITSWEPRNPQW